MTYTEWGERYPEAADALLQVLVCPPPADTCLSKRTPEAAVQQYVRHAVIRAGAYAWRNNVGATLAKCPECGLRKTPVRYGLANDSRQLNTRFKSGDLILAIPRLIYPKDVGTTIAQFGSLECKPVGWRFTGRGAESAQAAWATLINQIGGYARFTTGDFTL